MTISSRSSSTIKLAAAFLFASAALGASSRDADASVFNAVTDFSLSGGNPNGAWSYGYGSASGSTFTALQNSFTGGFAANTNFQYWQSSTPQFEVPLVARNVGAATLSIGTLISPTDVLLIHPGVSTEVLVKWTAPSAAVYSYSGLFELLDKSPTGVITGVYRNSLNLFSSTLTGPGANQGTLTPGQSAVFSGQVSLNFGDTLIFAVNNKGSVFNDSTGLKVTIESVPEPATLALIGIALMSLFGFGLMRQRSGI